MTPVLQGWIIIISTILLGGMTCVFIVLWMKSHRVRVRDPINKNAYVKDYWVTEKKDKDTGVLFWVSVMGKNIFNTPKPPASAIDVGKRGKKYAECYRVSEDEYIWISDNGIVLEEIEQKDGTKKKVVSEVLEDGSHHIIDTFKPFSPVQREVIVNQYRKAAELRSKKWTPEKIMGIASMGGLVVVIVALFIFWGDLAEPVLSMEARLEKREARIMAWEKQIVEAGCQVPPQNMYTPLPVDQNLIIQPGEEPPRAPS